jgi:beta-galactosidase
MRPTRRQVLGGIGAAAVVSMLAPGASAAAAESVPRSNDFGVGWRFAQLDPAGAAAPGFDDSGWREVDLPHDWSIELSPVTTGGTSSGSGFFPGGVGWYRKTFTLPPSTAGRRVSIEFDGIYANAQVYLNGTLLGSHPYAYTGVNYDLTELLHTDGSTPNVLAVRAENRLPSSRWYSGSGIYRNVHLIVTDPVHVARHGIFVTTPEPAGTVQASIEVANERTTNVDMQIRLTVLAEDGGPVARATTPLTVAAGQTGTGTASLRVDHPDLWSTDAPHLYQLCTEIVVGGQVLDSATTTFGFRYTSFDPNRGFSLNGSYTKLKGVDLHATQGPLGAVINYDALLRQMRLMKSMGVNALRTAHNPPAPELVAVCERLGIMMMVEAFDCWESGKVDYDYHLYFDQWSQYDISEMVHAAKNSPAVVLWSIGNETPDTWKPAGPGIAAKLIAAVKAIDTTRPIVMGSDQYRSVPADGSPQDGILKQLDGLGLNYNTAQSLDALHAKYPDKFFFESESSSETSTRGVYQDPQLLNTGENYTPGKRGTSSYDNNLASWTLSGEYGLKKDRDRRFFQGQFLWAGQDYIGEPTPYDVFPVKASFFGAVDTAGLPKDAYHLYRSQWASEPMVHIVPMDWTTHAPGENVAVWVYANVPTVELFLNGTSLGTRRFDRKTTTDGRPYLETTEPTGDDKNFPSGSYTSPNGSTGKLHLTWNVPFQPGTLVAVGRSGGAEVARDQLTTAGPARAVRLDGEPNGSMSFVTVSVVDGRGTIVPDAANTVAVTVHGPGRLAGVDNGKQDSAHGYQETSVDAFNGQAVAVIAATGERGMITVTATSPGLAPGRCTLPGSTTGRRTGPVAKPAAPDVPPTVDASYSGAPDTVPAAMVDGDPGTGWSNYYLKPATPTLNPVSASRPVDWVSLSWPKPRTLSGLTANFTTGANLALPTKIMVSYRTAHGWVPVNKLSVNWATVSDGPTTITFDAVDTTDIRLTMISATPGTAAGFLRISQLTAS